MRRRQLLALLGAAALVRPPACYAQHQKAMPVIGYMSGGSASFYQSILPAFREGLREQGYIEGQNVAIEYRWAEGDYDRLPAFAAELVNRKVDVIAATGGERASSEAKAATSTIPIVFAVVADPVGAGFVENLARPGGNATGFMAFEYSISGKWLELLKQVAPTITRVAVLRDSTTATGIGQFGVIQALAPSLRVEITQVNVRDPAEMERAILAFARAANGGLIVTASGLAFIHRNLIRDLAAQHRLPAIYFERRFVDEGGLIAYGPDQTDQFRRAAGYVDRILKGEKPADLPVQAPTRYELMINLRTAKAIGLEVPPALLARADEVIE